MTTITLKSKSEQDIHFLEASTNYESSSCCELSDDSSDSDDEQEYKHHKISVPKQNKTQVNLKLNIVQENTTPEDDEPENLETMQ